MEILNTTSFIDRLLKKYPRSTSIDIYKQIYQACFLTGHIIDSDSYSYLLNEYHDAFALSLHKELYEAIDYDVVRVNLASFTFNLIELFNVMKKSSEVKLNKDFDKLLYLYGLKKQDEIPHHSDVYKNNYHPSYRVCYLDYLPITYRIYKLSQFINDYTSEINQDKITFISIDGMPKSKMNYIASKILDVTVIDVNNQDIIEIDKLLSSLQVGKKFMYYRNDGCLKTIVTEECKPTVLVAGCMSYHPFLRKYYKYKVFILGGNTIDLRKNIDDELIEYYKSTDFIKDSDILI